MLEALLHLALVFTLKDGSDENATIKNRGIMEGDLVILAQESQFGLNASEQGVSIQNFVSIHGRSGIAFSLGDGKDSYYGAERSRLRGIGEFGGGDDLVSFSSDQYPYQYSVDPIQVFDGGLGNDTVEFGEDILSTAIISAILGASDSVDIEIAGPNSTYTKRFINFENFEFSDRTLTMADFAAVTAVPLPAPALMLGAALVGLGGVSRRRSGGGAGRRG